MKKTIQWVRQVLVSKGDLSKKEKGIWEITQFEIERVGREKYSNDNVVLDINYV